MKTSKKKLDWLNQKISQDKNELEREKNLLISEIIKCKKEEIVSSKKVKMSIWKRIRIVLMGY